MSRIVNGLLSKSYKDGDKWKDTDQLGTGDLLNAAKLLQVQNNSSVSNEQMPRVMRAPIRRLVLLIQIRCAATVPRIPLFLPLASYYKWERSRSIEKSAPGAIRSAVLKSPREVRHSQSLMS